MSDKKTSKRAVTARDVVKAVRGGKPPPKTPEHALVRVAAAAQSRTPIQCSMFGAPGGAYFARLTDKAKERKAKGERAPANPRKRRPWKPGDKQQRRRVKVRRVGHQEAHAIIRRPKGDVREDRVLELYWVPPELVALYDRDTLKEKLVGGGRLRPVWTASGGRQVQRGEGVVRRRGR